MISPDDNLPVRRADTGLIRVDSWRFVVPAMDREEFDRLPLAVRDEVSLLLGIFRVVARSESRERMWAAQATALRTRRSGFTAKSLKRKWYSYINGGGDWRVLINRSRVPVARGLPKAFVEFVQGWFVKNKRVSRQQWFKLRRFWENGCDDKGRAFLVPGYGTWQEWFRAQHPEQPLPVRCPGVPRGWSYSTLMRSRLNKASERMAREGEAAARSLTPHVLGTREALRFLEEVTFDDVKTDFRVIDAESGEVLDLWLLVAYDRATAMCLGYGMRPARVREDGSQEHLRLIDMKQLAGWVLERWGLPSTYPITWKLENGCATFPEATALALEDLSGGALTVSYARMINGVSVAGYKERALGNSRAKASHESHNNLMHNMAGDLPGQTGRRWDVRPADLASREKAAREIHSIAQRLSPQARKGMQYPVLTLHEAREELNRIFHQMNARTEHDLEGFLDLGEWRENVFAEWRPICTFPAIAPAGYETRTRKESPTERMDRLTAGIEFRRVARSTLIHFYHDTQKLVTVDERGEISFTFEKREHVFMAVEQWVAEGQRGSGEQGKSSEDANLLRASSPVPLCAAMPGSKFLAYFHPREPDYLHLTRLAPHSGYVATWVRRERVRHGDATGLKEQIQYTEHALKQQRDHLRRVSDEGRETQAMRENNARLIAEHSADTTAIEVSDMHAIAPVGPTEARPATMEGSGTGAGLDAAQAAIAHGQQSERARARERAAAADFAESILGNNQRKLED